MEKKFRLLLLLVLLMTAATGAWATDYTTLAVGDVIKVGDTFSPTADGAFNDNGVASGKTYTLMRADIDNDYNVTEKTDGAYYVFKYESIMSSPYIHFEKAFAVTAISDGLEVTKIEDMKGMLFYTLALHESSAAPTGYTVSMKDGVKDADKWTITPNPAEDGQTVTLQYNGRLKVKGVKATSEAGAPAVDPLAVPLTIEAITAGTITMTKPKEGMQYSLNGGAKTAVTATINVAAGDKVAFYGNGTTITSYGAVGSSQCTKITTKSEGFTCKVYGNIMSLVDEENFATATTLSATYTFKLLFGNNRAITDASGLLLPATQLAEYCYSEMFEGCSALTAAPALPATQLATSCYQRMFMGCSALTAAPVLPAETLVDNCYYQLFANCSRLATVTCLATSGINLSSSTTLWLNGAGSQAQGTKTVYTVSSAVWPEESNNGIPTGWVREVASSDEQAKPAATVTTAPTGAAVVGVGKTTALVSGGVADGGTLWYAVTTTNTKPTSTAGFSDAVPTAKTITASGKVYVWYYVKGDDTHSDSEIAATAIEVPVADIIWDVTNVSDLEVMGNFESYAKEGVTLSGNAEDVQARWRDKGDPTRDGIEFVVMEPGGYTFTAPTGKKFTKIEMTLTGSAGWDSTNLGSGWSFSEDDIAEICTVTWKGSAAASTVNLLKDTDSFVGEKVKSIVFYLSE